MTRWASFPRWAAEELTAFVAGSNAGTHMAAIRIYLALALESDFNTRVASVSWTTLQAVTGLSRPMITRGIEAAEAAGLIEVDRSSGTLMMEVLTARELLRWDWGIEAAVWSVTSYAELHRDGIECERRARLHPESPAAQPFVTRTMSSAQGPVIGVTDYVRAVPELIRAFVPHRYVTLGTDGFGWRDTRDALRAFFELDAASIVIAALKALVDEGSMEPARAAAAIARYGRDPVSLPQWSR